MARDLLSAEQLAKRWGVVPSTVLYWTETRGLPCVRLSKRTIRFDPAEIDGWLERRGKASGSNVDVPKQGEPEHRGTTAQRRGRAGGGRQ
jgi:excisionase family DNA binding protein